MTRYLSAFSGSPLWLREQFAQRQAERLGRSGGRDERDISPGVLHERPACPVNIDLGGRGLLGHAALMPFAPKSISKLPENGVVLMVLGRHYVTNMQQGSRLVCSVSVTIVLPMMSAMRNIWIGDRCLGVVPEDGRLASLSILLGLSRSRFEDRIDLPWQAWAGGVSPRPFQVRNPRVTLAKWAGRRTSVDSRLPGQDYETGGASPLVRFRAITTMHNAFLASRPREERF